MHGQPTGDGKAGVVLGAAAAAWGRDDFAAVLKRELLALPAGTLPLHLGTSQGGVVDPASLGLTVLGAVETGGEIRARAGVFFTEIVGGCSCGDDPLTANAYCELEIRIDPARGTARFSIL